MPQTFVIAGGTGFLGQSIIRHLQQKEPMKIIVLTRSPKPAEGNISYVKWDGCTLGKWTNALEGSTAIINLAGKSVNCRYTASNKQEIIASRVNAVLVIGKAIREAARPPKVWINAGSAAIFGNGGDSIKTEHSPAGDGFPAEVCKQWEQAFFSMATPQTRKVFLRAGLVFQKGTGLLVPFANLVKAGLGGKIGSGKQYISWIHEADFVNLVYAALTNGNYTGIVHVTSPQPVTNQHFMQALRQALHKTVGLPSPSLLVKLGAIFIKTEAELVLNGRRVVSDVLAQKKFVFQYPHIEGALQDLTSKNRNGSVAIN